MNFYCMGVMILHKSKFVIIVLYSIVCNTTNASNADISMNFKPDNSCVLSFDKSEKIFTNINR